MSLLPNLSTQGRAVGFDGRVDASSGLVGRVSLGTLQTVVAMAIVPMTVVLWWLALTSDHLQWPVASALYRSALMAALIGVGLYWWIRRPASRFGPLLVVVGVLVWVVSWQFSERPLVFDIGVVAEGPAFVLTFYLFLAFPMGRVDPPTARWLMVALAAVVFGFYVLWGCSHRRSTAWRR
jgi:hypothetical protein